MEEIEIDVVNDSLNYREFSELKLLEESSLLGLQGEDSAEDSTELMSVSSIPINGADILFSHIPKKGLSFQLWPSAVALAQYFSLPSLKSCICGKKILELGAGTGFLGSYLAKLGGQVLITDLEKAIGMIQKTIELNHVEKASEGKTGGFALAAPLNWFNSCSLAEVRSYFDPPDLKVTSSFSLDVICACDCIYNSSLHIPLLNTLLGLSTPQFALIFIVSRFV
jgi:predicted nicotinamide N-methyase